MLLESVPETSRVNAIEPSAQRKCRGNGRSAFGNWATNGA